MPAEAPANAKASGMTGAAPAKSRPADQAMGTALRSVYQQTVEEQIPPEMLDLLGKLD